MENLGSCLSEILGKQRCKTRLAPAVFLCFPRYILKNWSYHVQMLQGFTTISEELLIVLQCRVAQYLVEMLVNNLKSNKMFQKVWESFSKPQGL